MSGINIACPRDAVKVFGEVERYRLPLGAHHVRVVLDVGAHVGAFALAALRRWPAAVVHSYEPHPDNARMLRHNTTDLRVCVHPCAVVGAVTGATRRDKRLGPVVALHVGFTSLGHALSPLGWQSDQTIDVPALDGRELPPADVLKIDTEGSEDAIVRAYRHWPTVRGVIVEWHTPESRRFLEARMRHMGFVAVFDHPGPRTGVLGFVRPRFTEQ